jgi:hypothetical protein
VLVIDSAYLKTCELVTKRAPDCFVSGAETINEEWVRFLPSRRGIHARTSGSTEFADIDLETIGALHPWAQHCNSVVFALEWGKPNG